MNAFNLPVRLEVEGGFFQTVSANFCGIGDKSLCNDNGTASKVRYISPYGSVLSRFRIADEPTTQVAVGWRGTGYIPGNWGDFTPYEDSTFAALRPDGEPGFASQLMAGVVVDSRDYEIAPEKGILGAFFVRGAHPFIGSTWAFAGANAQLSVFAPLIRKRAVLAQRVIVDVIGGDPPLLELGKIGGLQESYAFGGQDVGRGLRTSRYAGPVKLMAQEEVRVELFHLDVFGNDLGIGSAVFLDVGAVAGDIDSLATRAPVPAFGGGVALRWSWNRSFVVRIDLAMSPIEGARVGLYTAPGQPF